MHAFEKTLESWFTLFRVSGHDVNQFVHAIFTVTKSHKTHQNMSFGSKCGGLGTFVLKKAPKSLFALFRASGARPGQVRTCHFHNGEIVQNA